MAEQDHYINEQGLMVFTEAWHRKRGYCCGNGCKHCPYEYEAVREPKRSDLKARKEMMNDSNSLSSCQ